MNGRRRRAGIQLNAWKHEVPGLDIQVAEYVVCLYRVYKISEQSDTRRTEDWSWPLTFPGHAFFFGTEYQFAQLQLIIFNVPSIQLKQAGYVQWIKVRPMPIKVEWTDIYQCAFYTFCLCVGSLSIATKPEAEAINIIWFKKCQTKNYWCFPICACFLTRAYFFIVSSKHASKRKTFMRSIHVRMCLTLQAH